MNQSGTTNIGSTLTTVYTYTATNGGIFGLAITADGGNAGSTSFTLNADIAVNGSTVFSTNDVSRANYAGNNNANVYCGLTMKVDPGASIAFRLSQANRTSNLSWRVVVAQIY